MEELESFFELFFAGIVVVISLIASAKKAKNQRIADAAKQSRAQEQTASQPEPAWKPAQPTVLPPIVFADFLQKVNAPTVHPHLEPDCDTHDVPGSLGVTSTEGKDPCPEEQLTHTRSFQEPAPEEPGITFDWSGESMVKAFVMQEILTRPCQRQTRLPIH